MGYFRLYVTDSPVWLRRIWKIPPSVCETSRLCCWACSVLSPSSLVTVWRATCSPWRWPGNKQTFCSVYTVQWINAVKACRHNLRVSLVPLADPHFGCRHVHRVSSPTRAPLQTCLKESDGGPPETHYPRQRWENVTELQQCFKHSFRALLLRSGLVIWDGIL